MIVRERGPFKKNGWPYLKAMTVDREMLMKISKMSLRAVHGTGALSVSYTHSDAADDFAVV